MRSRRRLDYLSFILPEVHVHLLAAASNGYMVDLMPRSTAILVNMPVPSDDVLRPAEGCARRTGHDAVSRHDRQ
jgi:hypothetical protein